MEETLLDYLRRTATGFVRVSLCLFGASTCTVLGQESIGNVSTGIPYLAPMFEPELGVSPTATVGATGFSGPEPGFRPYYGMTELPLPGHHADCICGRKSLMKKILRKKCRVHPDIPPTFVPNPFEAPPLGARTFEIMNTQVKNHDATRQVLNHYDFIDDSAELNYAGKRKLMRIAQGSQTNFAPIVVEATPRQPGLDQSRRQRLTQEIASLGLPIPSERVIVGLSHQQGLRGPEAMVLYPGSVSHLMQGMGGGSGGMAGGGGAINNSGIMGGGSSGGMGGSSMGGSSMGGGGMGGGSGGF